MKQYHKAAVNSYSKFMCSLYKKHLHNMIVEYKAIHTLVNVRQQSKKTTYYHAVDSNVEEKKVHK